MSASNISFPVIVQEGILDALQFFNGYIFIFIRIITTSIYFIDQEYTLWSTPEPCGFTVVSKKAENTNRRIVLSVISVLYLICFSDFIFQWYFLDWFVVVNGDTRESIFFGTLGGGPAWMGVLNTFLFYSLLIVSDGLLIWRCYHVWGQSFLVILGPLILFVTEFGLFATATTLAGLTNTITSNTKDIIVSNLISSAVTLVSLVTTIITTLLIGYKIHSSSRFDKSPSKRLFNHVVVLVTESAAAYSLILLFEAIFTIDTSFSVVGSPYLLVQYYLEVVTIFVAKQGMAPTVLVARIVLRNPNSTAASTITHVSGLQFGSQPRNGHRASVFLILTLTQEMWLPLQWLQ
ncbi:hypothetical protein CVT25_009221 [Psilocybe cyanescens]|uniref:Uncharacterized protein n=1 Tax=Psilocybe cyanescens TaxID=93625 RepID=A0A409WWE3_PSICY|nr:hypothetical protein CVT25_009221 [Psilocybe cyanescens]